METYFVGLLYRYVIGVASKEH